MTKSYRKIFVVQSIRADFSSLVEAADEIHFLTSGNESSKDLFKVIKEGLKDFIPHMDAIVPAGKSFGCLLTGLALSEIVAKREPITLGLFYSDNGEKNYYFSEVYLE